MALVEQLALNAEVNAMIIPLMRLHSTAHGSLRLGQ